MNNNSDKNKLIDAIISSSSGKINRNAVENATSGNINSLLSSLSSDDRKKIEAVLSNENAKKQLLSSDAAQQILKKLSGK